VGLMDKVKAQAATLAQKTQETANAAQAKIDSAQANRRADGLLRSLGLAYLAERTGRATPETSAQIDKLLSDLAQHESQHNFNLVEQSAAAQQMQMQTGPGQVLSSSQVAADPYVSAAPAGYPQQAAPAASTGFPGAGPTSFPQGGGVTGFPEPGGATSFPQGGGVTGFPASAPPIFFPGAAPVGFPESVAEPAPEQTEQATGFPDAGGTTGFPPASGA